MTTALLTPEDLALINKKIRPKNRKGILLFSLVSLCFCFLLPFMPGRFKHISPYAEGIYWYAFVFYLVVFSAITMLIYYRFIMSVDQDVRDGEKIIARLPVKIKNTLIFGGKFDLIFERGRLLYTPKITLSRTEIDHWREGDLVDLELLYKSGEVLKYKKVNQ